MVLNITGTTLQHAIASLFREIHYFVTIARINTKLQTNPQPNPTQPNPTKLYTRYHMCAYQIPGTRCMIRGYPRNLYLGPASTSCRTRTYFRPPTIMGSETANETGCPFIVLKPASNAVGSDGSFLIAYTEKTSFSHIALQRCHESSPHRAWITTKLGERMLH